MADDIWLANAYGYLDGVLWDATWPKGPGIAMALDPYFSDPTSNDDVGYWCEATTAFGSGDLGTPGDMNDACFGSYDFDGDGYDMEAAGGTDCDDTDASVNPGATDDTVDGIDQDCDGTDGPLYLGVDDLVEGDLVITEMMPNPDAVSDFYGEWFEVYNASGVTVDLDGLVVSDSGGSSFTVTGTLEVGAGEYAVLGISGNTSINGGVTVDYDYNGMTLANVADDLWLANAYGYLDGVLWAAGWPKSAGVAMALDPDATDPTSNDDLASWCEATTPYGLGDLGTPGSVNDDCAAVTDADGDGYDDVAYGGTDCDDTDASVNPGAAEVCDGIDNDCDGDADGGATDAGTWYEDYDGDGYGDAAYSATACDQPTGYVADDTDCDDLDASVNPGAADDSADGVDQNCDGVDGPLGLGVDDLVEGDLVITEVMPNPDAVSDFYGEWFEVYNAAGDTVDLDGLVVSDSLGTSFTVSGTLLVSAGDYVVFGIDGATARNGGVTVDYDYSGMTLANVADDFWLSNTYGTIDTVLWAAGWPKGAGIAVALDPSAIDSASNDDIAYWCEATTAYGLGDLGTPGSTNDSCGVVTDMDGDGYDDDDVAYGGTDCDDTDETVNPGSDELCDGVDNDCDGDVDGGALDAGTWYEDWDGDGYGDPAVSTTACDQPTGYVADDTDCDDTDASVNPGATDDSADGIDQNCDGYDGPGALSVDDLVAGDLVVSEIMNNPNMVADAAGEWFEVYNASGDDVDLEGLVVSDAGTDSFTVVGSLVVAAGDYVVFGISDDTSLNGGAPVDYVFSGLILGNSDDELYLDNAYERIDAVEHDDATWPDTAGAAISLDPDALDATSNDDYTNWCDATSAFGLGDLGTPGAANDDCAAVTTDADGDGYDDVAYGGTDCDDTDASVNPGATEVCDGIDNDCDGDADGGATDAGTWYEDYDSDGYGDPAVSTTACDQPTGYVDDDTDCDDLDASVNPGATDDSVDGIDQDCDGIDGPAVLTVDELIVGDLVITEVMPNPDVSSDFYGEWFEVYNASGWTIDLEGLDVSNGAATEGFTVVGSLEVADGDYVLFGISADTSLNGGVTVDYDYGTFVLANVADDIYLSNAWGDLDGVVYVAGWPKGAGYAMGLDPSVMDPTSNDAIGNWCAQVTTFGAGDRGTPGDVNDSCL